MLTFSKKVVLLEEEEVNFEVKYYICVLVIIVTITIFFTSEFVGLIIATNTNEINKIPFPPPKAYMFLEWFQVQQF